MFSKISNGTNKRPCRSTFRTKARYSRAGFSLVEMMVYVALLTVILVAVVNMLLVMSRAYSFYKVSRRLQSSAVFALDRMVRDIRNSRNVDLSASALGVSPGVLTLNTTQATGTPETLQFYVSNDVLRLKQDSGDIGPLTIDGVTVRSLVFRHMNTGISQAVKIELTLGSGAGSFARSANFYATALLRDSY